jgi:hypothetical protein
VALNKIDGLREGGKSEAEVLVEIDRQVRRAADVSAWRPRGSSRYRRGRA